MKYKDTHNIDWLNKLKERVEENPSQLSPDSWSKMEQKLSESGYLSSKVLNEENSMESRNSQKQRKAKTFYSLKRTYIYTAIAAMCILILGNYFLFNMQGFSKKAPLNIRYKNHSNILIPELRQIDIISQEPSSYINDIMLKSFNAFAIKFKRANKLLDLYSKNENSQNSPNNLKLSLNKFKDIVPKINEISKKIEDTLVKKENLPYVKTTTLNKVEDDYIAFLNTKTMQKKRANWAMSIAGNPIISNSSNSSYTQSRASDPSFLYSKEFKIVNNQILTLRSSNPNNYIHKKPLNFGISISKELTPTYFISSGLFYSFLSSDLVYTDGNKITQKLVYITIPLVLNYKFISNSIYTLYLGVGGGVGKCIYGKLGDKKLKNNKLQVSISSNLGFQLEISHHFGIYVEPKIAYYFDDNSGIESYWKDNKLNFNFQLGFRFKY